MTASPSDVAELDRLRGELLSRLNARPFEWWSTTLLRAVIGVLDLDTASCVPPPKPGERLRIVT
jgi:hypothetical protein